MSHSISSLSKPDFKVSVLSRSLLDYSRQTHNEIPKLFKNIDPAIHPFEKAKEYTRALQATKLDKIFAKPFQYSLDAHSDGIYCMNTLKNSLIALVSGACDGELRVWDLAFKKTVWKVKAHAGFVRGISSSSDSNTILTCGDDKTIKLWSRNQPDNIDIVSPISTILGNSAFLSIDSQYDTNIYATAGDGVGLYDLNRTSVLHHFSWGADSNHIVRFNPVETNILISSASDRNLVLYDVRSKSPLRKLIMQMNTNGICWNPMEAFNFTLANEDHNCYTFDMRNLSSALNVHVDHVSAVMSIDYSPTGKEFVTGSYDNTVRIFSAQEGHSREIYHTKRMQRVFAVKYSADNRFVLSGSDDANIRLWKAQASAPLKALLPPEKNKLEYNDKLKERFKHAPEIRRIAKHRQVPQHIKSQIHQKRVMHQAERSKLERIKAHSKPGSVQIISERKKHIVKQIE